MKPFLKKLDMGGKVSGDLMVASDKARLEYKGVLPVA